VSITRPSAMTPEEIEKILRAVADRGASIQVTDPGLTAAKNWILSAIGIAVIGGYVSLISAVNSLKEQNATLIAEIKFQQQVNTSQDTRLSIYDDRLRAVERATR
jgi:hypothetical protein